MHIDFMAETLTKVTSGGDDSSFDVLCMRIKKNADPTI